MKANQKTKSFRSDTNGNTKLVGGIVALLLVIIVGVLVFYQTEDSVSSFDEQYEEFTGYTRWAGGTTGSNYTGVTITLSISPNNAADTNVTCYNESGGAGEIEGYPAFTLNHKNIVIAGNATGNFTQVNVTYTTHMGSDSAEVMGMAGTIFSLLPLIALVMVAGVILAVVMNFGSGRKNGGL